MPATDRLLDAALATFGRFGFRKTSMEEVARAAGISRQGLYGHYATKEDLFRAAVEHACASGLDDASERVADDKLSLEQKLVGAFDAWTGRYVGLVGENVVDLHEAVTMFGAELIAKYEERFAKVVETVVKKSKLPARGIPARALADTLQATAHGLKTKCKSRGEFVERIAIAVRAICRE